MATVQSLIDEKLRSAKSFEAQRAMLAEMRGDDEAAARHFLAAGHMELVLAEDYRQAKKTNLVLRSFLAAASCFWRAGQSDKATDIFRSLVRKYPKRKKHIGMIEADLQQAYPKVKST